MGRYIPYHLNPLSVAESEDPVSPDEVFQRIEPRYNWLDLMKFGGFPEPLLARYGNECLEIIATCYLNLDPIL